MLQTLESRRTSATVAVGTDAREYLTFRLGKEEYGIDILKVQEIRSYDAVTAIANLYVGLFGLLRIDIKAERLDIAAKEQAVGDADSRSK